MATGKGGRQPGKTPGKGARRTTATGREAEAIADSEFDKEFEGLHRTIGLMTAEDYRTQHHPFLLRLQTNKGLPVSTAVLWIRSYNELFLSSDILEPIESRAISPSFLSRLQLHESLRPNRALAVQIRLIDHRPDSDVGSSINEVNGTGSGSGPGPGAMALGGVGYGAYQRNERVEEIVLDNVRGHAASRSKEVFQEMVWDVALGVLYLLISYVLMICCGYIGPGDYDETGIELWIDLLANFVGQVSMWWLNWQGFDYIFYVAREKIPSHRFFTKLSLCPIYFSTPSPFPRPSSSSSSSSSSSRASSRSSSRAQSRTSSPVPRSDPSSSSSSSSSSSNGPSSSSSGSTSSSRSSSPFPGPPGGYVAPTPVHPLVRPFPSSGPSSPGSTSSSLSSSSSSALSVTTPLVSHGPRGSGTSSPLSVMPMVGGGMTGRANGSSGTTSGTASPDLDDYSARSSLYSPLDSQMIDLQDDEDYGDDLADGDEDEAQRLLAADSVLSSSHTHSYHTVDV